jgi:hypothetical protein
VARHRQVTQPPVDPKNRPEVSSTIYTIMCACRDGASAAVARVVRLAGVYRFGWTSFRHRNQHVCFADPLVVMNEHRTPADFGNARGWAAFNVAAAAPDRFSAASLQNRLSFSTAVQAVRVSTSARLKRFPRAKRRSRFVPRSHPGVIKAYAEVGNLL